MRCLRIKMLLFILLGVSSISGCGGSGSNGSTGDPLAGTKGDGTVNNGPVTGIPTGSGTVLNYTLSLTTVGSSGSSTVGSNSTVIATATLKDNSGRPVAGQPVKFEEIATTTDDSVTIPAPQVVTSSEGTATTFLMTSSKNVNRDAIIKVSTSIGGQDVSSVSIFKIVRSAGNYIDFITTREPSDPDGNLNRLDVSVNALDPVLHPTTGILQLVTLQVLDKNGQKRTSVPVTLQIENFLGDCSQVNLHNTQSVTETVLTDDTGLAVFSAGLQLFTPPIGSHSSCEVIYKATADNPYWSTGDPDSARQLFSYGGYIASVTNIKN
jgi:hypothetical protein